MRRLRNHAEFVGVLRRHQRVTSADIVVHYALTPEKTGEEGVLRSRGGSPASSFGTRQAPDPGDHSDYSDDSGDHNHKIGLAVPNSVGHAVVRNKIKRRFRVLGRRHESLLPPGCKVILRAKPSAARAEFADLDRQVARLFAKIRRRAEHEGDGR